MYMYILFVCCTEHFITSITIILVIKYTHCDKYTNQGAFKGGGDGGLCPRIQV